MTECVNIYRAVDANDSARGLCCRAVFVTLTIDVSKPPILLGYQTFSSPGGPIILVFQKTVKF